MSSLFDSKTHDICGRPIIESTAKYLIEGTPEYLERQQKLIEMQEKMAKHTEPCPVIRPSVGQCTLEDWC